MLNISGIFVERTICYISNIIYIYITTGLDEHYDTSIESIRRNDSRNIIYANSDEREATLQHCTDDEIDMLIDILPACWSQHINFSNRDYIGKIVLPV